MDRHKITPAAYVILEKAGEILLVRRANTGYFDGSYSLPAGHVEESETPSECALRELKEEVGVEADELICVSVVYSGIGNRGDYVNFFFKTEVWNGEVTNCEPGKCDDVKWFSLNALPENIVPEVKAVLENIKVGSFYTEI